MSDLWHIHGAPAWLHFDLVFGRMSGLMEASPEGVLTVACAPHPDLTVLEVQRALPSADRDKPPGPLRFETAFFAIDRERHRLTYRGSRFTAAAPPPAPATGTPDRPAVAIAPPAG